MTEPFIAEVRIWALPFTPQNWASCTGQLLPISQYQSVFSVMRNNFGGDGQTSFGIPNFQGTAPMNWGVNPHLSDRKIGESGGSNVIQLTQPQLPAHTHQIYGDNQLPESGTPTSNSLMGFLIIDGKPGNAYASTPEEVPSTTLSSSALTETGSSQPHENTQPALVLNFCLALTGTTPVMNSSVIRPD